MESPLWFMCQKAGHLTRMLNCEFSLPLCDLCFMCCYVGSSVTVLCFQIAISIYISRLMVVSVEAKKKQHARSSSALRDHYSEFTWMAALKFKNTVAKPL